MHCLSIRVAPLELITDQYHTTHNSSRTPERASLISLSIYLFTIQSIYYPIYPFYPCRLDDSRGLYRRPDEDLTAPHFFVTAMVRRRRLSCLPTCACLSLYCQFEWPSLSCTNFAGRRQLLTSQLKPKPACR